MQSTSPTILLSGERRTGWLGGLGVRFMIDGPTSRGGFALVEHPLKPRALAAPLHRHSREDEYSYVLKGKIGALLGDHVVYAGPGDLVHKPRGQWHTFWNATDEEASLLEIISPAGFEKYFEEIIDVVHASGGRPQPETLGAIAARYGLELNPTTIPDLCREHGLAFG